MTRIDRRTGLPDFSRPYPTALEVLTDRSTFALDDYGNLATRHMRSIIGTAIPEATPLDDSDILEHWIQWYTDRILTKRDCVTVVDGEAGEGKSTWSLWFAAHLRDRLGRELGTSRRLDLEHDVVYRLSALVKRVYQSSRDDPQIVVADEGVLVGSQAGSGLSETGKILDRVLSIARIQGVTLFVLSPSIWGVASFIRMRRARVWAHIEHRGLTTMFTLRTATDFRPPSVLPFSKARSPWAKIRWPSLEDDPIWGPYERRKVETVKQTLTDSEIEAWRLEDRAGMRPTGPESMPYFKRASRGLGAEAPERAPRCAVPGCESRPVGRSARCEKHRREHVRELTRDRTARYRRT